MYSRFWGFFMAEGWEPYAVSRISTYSSQAYFFHSDVFKSSRFSCASDLDKDFSETEIK